MYEKEEIWEELCEWEVNVAERFCKKLPVPVSARYKFPIDICLFMVIKYIKEAKCFLAMCWGAEMCISDWAVLLWDELQSFCFSNISLVCPSAACRVLEMRQFWEECEMKAKFLQEKDKRGAKKQLFLARKCLMTTISYLAACPNNRLVEHMSLWLTHHMHSTCLFSAEDWVRCGVLTNRTQKRIKLISKGHTASMKKRMENFVLALCGRVEHDAIRHADLVMLSGNLDEVWALIAIGIDEVHKRAANCIYNWFVSDYFMFYINIFNNFCKECYWDKHLRGGHLDFSHITEEYGYDLMEGEEEDCMVDKFLQKNPKYRKYLPTGEKIPSFFNMRRLCHIRKLVFATIALFCRGEPFGVFDEHPRTYSVQDNLVETVYSPETSKTYFKIDKLEFDWEVRMSTRLEFKHWWINNESLAKLVEIPDDYTEKAYLGGQNSEKNYGVETCSEEFVLYRLIHFMPFKNDQVMQNPKDTWKDKVVGVAETCFLSFTLDKFQKGEPLYVGDEDGALLDAKLLLKKLINHKENTIKLAGLEKESTILESLKQAESSMLPFPDSDSSWKRFTADSEACGKKRRNDVMKDDKEIYFDKVNAVKRQRARVEAYDLTPILVKLRPELVRSDDVYEQSPATNSTGCRPGCLKKNCYGCDLEAEHFYPVLIEFPDWQNSEGNFGTRLTGFSLPETLTTKDIVSIINAYERFYVDFKDMLLKGVMKKRLMNGYTETQIKGGFCENGTEPVDEIITVERKQCTVAKTPVEKPKMQEEDIACSPMHHLIADADEEFKWAKNGGSADHTFIDYFCSLLLACLLCNTSSFPLSLTTKEVYIVTRQFLNLNDFCCDPSSVYWNFSGRIYRQLMGIQPRENIKAICAKMATHSEQHYTKTKRILERMVGLLHKRVEKKAIPLSNLFGELHATENIAMLPFKTTEGLKYRCFFVDYETFKIRVSSCRNSLLKNACITSSSGDTLDTIFL